MKRWMWYAIAIGLGAAGGYVYWSQVGCTNGCAITGQWWSSTAYGAVMGYLLLGLVKPANQPPSGVLPSANDPEERS